MVETRGPETFKEATVRVKERAMTRWVQLYFVLPFCEWTEVQDVWASAPGSQSLCFAFRGKAKANLQQLRAADSPEGR